MYMQKNIDVKKAKEYVDKINIYKCIYKHINVYLCMCIYIEMHLEKYLCGNVKEHINNRKYKNL